MSFEESASNHSENPVSAEEQAEIAKQGTQAELLNLNNDILLSSLPESARTYLDHQNLSADLNNQTLLFLHHVKAPEFGGLQNIPEAFWPVVLADCISTVKDNTKIADLSEQLSEQKQTNDQKRETITALKDRITSNLTGPNKQAQLADLIAKVKSQADFPKAEKQSALTHLEQIASTLSHMASVFPELKKQQAFSEIVASNAIDLGASDLNEAFKPIMVHVEASGVFSDDEKRRLRQIVTGSQAQDMLAQTVIDDNGNETAAWPKDNPMPIRPGLSMYVKGNSRHMLRLEFGDHISEMDMSGVSGEVLGKYIEAMSFIHDVESYGVTGLLHSIYQIDFNVFGNEGFDMDKINQVLGVMGKMFGGFEHTDGDIRRSGDRKSLIRHMARLLTPSGSATGFAESQADTDKITRDLGLKNKDGSPNWKQIERMGEFVQSTYLTGDASYDDLKAYLTQGELHKA